MTILTMITKFFEAFYAILGNQQGNVGFMDGAGGTNGEGAGASGSDGGDTGGSGDGASGDSTSNGQEQKVNYPTGIDESLIGSPIFDSFTNSDGNIDYANLMKSYSHQQRLIGKDKIVAPDDTTTSDQWNNIYDKLGRPARDKYEVKNNVPEGMETNDDMFKGLIDKAHENGILPRQLQPVLDYINEQTGINSSNMQEQAQAASTAEIQALKEEWGQGFEKNVGKADAALRQFATDEQIQALAKSGALNNPALTRLFAKIGDGLSEDTTFHDDAKRTYGITPDEAKAKLGDFYNKETSLGAAFNNTMHPQNKWAREEFMKLQTILHGSKKSGQGYNFSA